MSNSSFDNLIRNALAKYEELEKSKTTDFPFKAMEARGAAKSLHVALVGLPDEAKYFTANLLEASQNVLKHLKEDGAFTADEQNSVREAIKQFRSVTDRFQEHSKPSSDGIAEAFMSGRVRNAVGIGAFLVFLLGAVSAAKGTPSTESPWTTFSYWCGFGALALAGVWVLANFAAGRRLFAFLGSGKAGADLQYLVFGGMAFLVLALLVAGVMTGNLLHFLSETPGARGLITFLIAIGTIAIAIILALASVLTEASDVEMLKERLARGKEILTVLVGVLGTIVGFYFANNPDGAKMTVAFVNSPPAQVQAGGSFSVLAITTGGELPYDPAPIITVGKGVEAEGSVNPQGVLNVTFKVADSAETGARALLVGVRDKSGKTASIKWETKIVK